MTGPQRRLLDRARLQATIGKPLHVRGSDLAVARRLAKDGYVDLTIGGDGLPWHGHWWYQITPAEPS